MLESLLKDLEMMKKENEENMKRLNKVLDDFDKTNEELMSYYAQRRKKDEETLNALLGL